MDEYRLDDLGWFQFERMCQALLKAAHGTAVEAWGGSGDWGRDAYAEAPLRYPDPNVERDGPFVFQVKHVTGANAAGANPRAAVLQAVSKERTRIRERLAAGTWLSPRFFTFITNAPLSPGDRASIAGRLRSDLPDCVVVCLGVSDVSALLDNHPSVRNSFPQVLGLRDLQSLIKYAMTAHLTVRSSFAIEASHDLARVFVPTKPYRQALDLATRHGFVVLTGPPEMGKTAIARVMSLAKYFEGWDAYDCVEPDDVFAGYDPRRRQVFVADDAFGSTEYRPEIAYRWAAVLDRLLSAADAKHWILWTSRPGPLREGLQQSSHSGTKSKFPDPGTVQVDTSLLSVAEKAEMLYRHAKASDLGAEARSFIRQNAALIVSSRHFTPLRIWRFVHDQAPLFASGPKDEQRRQLADAISVAMKNPTEPMRASFAALSAEHRATLFALLDTQGRGPVPLSRVKARVEGLLGHPPQASVATHAELIEDHFIKLESSPGGTEVDWVHPSVRDVIIEYLSTHDQDRQRFLETTSSSGVVLAVSVGGGAGGQLALPLLLDEKDWEVLTDRVLVIIQTEGLAEHLEILQGLLSATSSGPEQAAANASALQSLSQRALAALADVWRAPSETLTTDHLRAYYRLSVASQVLVNPPQILPVWQGQVSRLEAFPDREYAPLSWIEGWASLAYLLSEYEPRFLHIVGFPSSLEGEMEAVLHALERFIENLEDLDEEEEEAVEIADDEWASLPIEPSSEEDEERRWLERVEPVLESIAELMPNLADRVRPMRVAAQRHFEIRQARSDRFQSIGEYGQDYDDRQARWVGSEPSSAFSIEAFFSDL